MGTQRMPLSPQRRLHATLCGGTASFPWANPGCSPPAARWLLCVRSFQLLSISLNGPIQGHSCASETPAAWTQQLRGALHMRMCPLGLPPGAPIVRWSLGPRSASRGLTWTEIGGSFILCTWGLWKGRKECASWGLHQLIFDSDLQLLSLCPTQLIPCLRPEILPLLSSQSCIPEALNKCC